MAKDEIDEYNRIVADAVHMATEEHELGEFIDECIQNQLKILMPDSVGKVEAIRKAWDNVKYILLAKLTEERRIQNGEEPDLPSTYQDNIQETLDYLIRQQSNPVYKIAQNDFNDNYADWVGEIFRKMRADAEYQSKASLEAAIKPLPIDIRAENERRAAREAEKAALEAKRKKNED